jgi:hypothetical protein
MLLLEPESHAEVGPLYMPISRLPRADRSHRPAGAGCRSSGRSSPSRWASVDHPGRMSSTGWRRFGPLWNSGGFPVRTRGPRGWPSGLGSTGGLSCVDPVESTRPQPAAGRVDLIAGSPSHGLGSVGRSVERGLPNERHDRMSLTLPSQPCQILQMTLTATEAATLLRPKRDKAMVTPGTGYNETVYTLRRNRSTPPHRRPGPSDPGAPLQSEVPRREPV